LNNYKPYNNTRLFNQLSELLDAAVTATDNFPKSHRYVIGAEIQRICVRSLNEFSTAYLEHGPQCLTMMNALLSDIGLLRILVSMAVDKEWIKGRKKAEHLIRLVDSVTKQSTALRNSFAAKYDGKDESKA
jgi:hypothetical protein